MGGDDASAGMMVGGLGTLEVTTTRGMVVVVPWVDLTWTPCSVSIVMFLASSNVKGFCTGLGAIGIGVNLGAGGVDADFLLGAGFSESEDTCRRGHVIGVD